MNDLTTIKGKDCVFINFQSPIQVGTKYSIKIDLNEINEFIFTIMDTWHKEKIFQSKVTLKNITTDKFDDIKILLRLYGFIIPEIELVTVNDKIIVLPKKDANELEKSYLKLDLGHTDISAFCKNYVAEEILKEGGN